MFGRMRFEHGRIGRGRQPFRALRALDAARQNQYRVPAQRRTEIVQMRIRRRDFRKQRFADFGVADREFPGLDRRKQHAFFAGSFFVERAFDRRQHSRLVYDDYRAIVQIVEHRLALLECERQPRFRNLGAALQILAKRARDVRRTAVTLQ